MATERLKETRSHVSVHATLRLVQQGEGQDPGRLSQPWYILKLSGSPLPGNAKGHQLKVSAHLEDTSTFFKSETGGLGDGKGMLKTLAPVGILSPDMGTVSQRSVLRSSFQGTVSNSITHFPTHLPKAAPGMGGHLSVTCQIGIDRKEGFRGPPRTLGQKV